MTKKTTIQKEPVKLREKKLANGNVSLYLDIYRNGKRQKEYLKLYLIDATTPLEREQNRQTLATAQAIKSKRLIEMQNGEYSFTRQFKEDTPFWNTIGRWLKKDTRILNLTETGVTGEAACVISKSIVMIKPHSKILLRSL